MERSSTCSSGERIRLESDLRHWFAGQGVGQEGAARAVLLLDAGTLLATPRPSRWNRRGQFGVQERCRYLWYRHAARILGWCERRRFPDTVTAILRTHVFPTQGARHEATREDGEGRVTANLHTAPSSIDARQHSAGQSSCDYVKMPGSGKCKLLLVFSVACIWWVRLAGLVIDLLFEKCMALCVSREVC